MPGYPTSWSTRLTPCCLRYVAAAVAAAIAMLCQLKNLTSNGGTDTGCDRQEAHTHHVLARLIRVGATTRIVTIVCATLSSQTPRTSSRSALFPPPLYRLGLRAELNLNFKHLPGSKTIHSNLISNACFMGFLCFLTLLATGNCVGIFRSYFPPPPGKSFAFHLELL